MNKTTKNKEIYTSIEDYEKNCYLFSPSIGQHRTVCGKPYFVRRYFRGDNDFEETMKRLAVEQANKSVGVKL